MSSQKFYFLSV